MTAEILSIGNELTLGVTVDTNSAWISQQLAAIGIPVTRHVGVGDGREAIAVAMKEAAGRADLLIVSGGLGPTADDLTRAAMADAMGSELIKDEAALRTIQRFFDRIGREMGERNMSQAYVPAGAEMIDNTCGTAPGLQGKIGRCRIFVVPGVPREMREMMTLSVLPQLTGDGGVIRQRVLYCYGTGESNIGEKIIDLMAEGSNPAIGTTARNGVIGVRITATGGEDEIAAILDDAEREIRNRLGELVFGVDNDDIAVAVAALLVKHHKTIAVAESCTAGLIASMLGSVPGISAHLLEGVVTYSNAAKTRLLGVPAEMIEAHGAVSEQVARAMAEGCRRRSGADIAVSVTGIAGPTGGTAEKPVGLTYIALADAEGSEVHRYIFPGTRNIVRDRAAKTALNRLRKFVVRSS